MNTYVERLYSAAPRFDESPLYNSAEYDRLTALRDRLSKVILSYAGPAALDILEQYAEALYEQTELECRHFFEQGYIAGKADQSA